MKKLICLGDSITDANRLFSPGGLGEGYVSMLPPLLPDFEIVNKGVDGFTVSRLLQNIHTDCIQRKPDLVSVQIGINNIGLLMNTNRTPAQQGEMLAQYVSEYTGLLKTLTEHTKAKIILLEPFVFPCPGELANWIPHVEKFSGHIRELADIFGCEFLPLHRLLNQESLRLGYPAVTPDGIHLTRHSHELLAQSLAKKINHTV